MIWCVVRCLCCSMMLIHGGGCGALHNKKTFDSVHFCARAHLGHFDRLDGRLRLLLGHVDDAREHGRHGLLFLTGRVGGWVGLVEPRQTAARQAFTRKRFACCVSVCMLDCGSNGSLAREAASVSLITSCTSAFMQWRRARARCRFHRSLEKTSSHLLAAHGGVDARAGAAEGARRAHARVCARRRRRGGGQ